MSQIMDAIVIGCGAAGIAAVRKLHDAGLKVIGLEAADRIGGRICSVPFSDAIVDMGAAWCHGEKDNIVFDLANPLGLIGRPQGPMQQIFVQSNGEVLNDTKIQNILTETVDKAEKNSDKSISSTLKEAAKTNEILKKDPELTNSFIELYTRNDLHVGSVNDPRKDKSLRGLAESWNCGGEPWLHWKGKGYQTILNVLLNKYPDPSKEIAVQLLLNKEVESIKWSSTRAGQVNSLVQVTCKDGSLYAARSVVVTVSVKVLKDRHAQLFNPPLPAEKVTTINTLQMAILDKIYVEFEKPWWKSPVNFFIIWNEEDKAKFSREDKWITEIFGLQYIESHKNVLLAWICGDGARNMEKVSLEGVKAGIEKLLEVVFKKFDVTPIKKILRTQWASNNLTGGAYAYRSVATEQEGGSAEVLSNPVYHNDIPVLCFAGEATSHHHFGAVHGAIESGFREADRIIASLKK